MTRIAAALLLVTSTLALAACGGGGSSADETTQITTADADGGFTANVHLDGAVGPGFEIEVKEKNGDNVESLPAGTYTLEVEDKSSIHNFHLIGPGVDDEVTSVDFEGDKTVDVTLQKGTYTYQCDPHASSGMKGTFEVT